MGYEGQFRVWRGDSNDGDFEDYAVDVNEGEVVLDIIHRIQATQAPDLAVRWNCKAGKCGSCSAEINGRPRLMCMTRMSTFTEDETITVTPDADLPRHPRPGHRRVVQLQEGARGPVVRPPEDLEPGDYRMTAGRRRAARRSSASASSASCATTPATSCATTRRTRPISPGRDSSCGSASSRCTRSTPPTGAGWRSEDHGLGFCNITKCCTEVCPEHIHITDNALIPLKERVVDLKYDPAVGGASALPTRGSRKALKLVASDPAKAEALALQRLHGRPADRTALKALAEARHAQGNYSGAAEASRESLAHAPAHGPRRGTAAIFHTRMLLDAVESGQLSIDSAEVELTETLTSAQRAVSSSRTLTSLHAREAAANSRWDDALHWLGEGRGWQRGSHEEADDLLTLAVVHAAQGHPNEAAEELAQSGSEWPDNPRLSFLRSKVSTG